MGSMNTLYDKITRDIVAHLEQDNPPWHRPWAVNRNGAARPVRENGVPYKGINVLILWAAALDAGYVSGCWMTYRQASKIGAQVRRGERATRIVFAKTFTKSVRDPASGEMDDMVLPVRRSYAVFNADQIDNLPPRYRPEPPPAINPDERNARCDAWFASLGINIHHGTSMAYYAPGADCIHMPAFQSFESADHYLSTLAHESIHATGHKQRLDRLDGLHDDKSRAREELIAEIGSAFLCADLGIASSPRADHAAYIRSWITLLENDTRAVFDAATKAQRAADFLHDLAGDEARAAA